jgi:hypothetical protein
MYAVYRKSEIENEFRSYDDEEYKNDTIHIVREWL